MPRGGVLDEVSAWSPPEHPAAPSSQPAAGSCDDRSLSYQQISRCRGLRFACAHRQECRGFAQRVAVRLGADIAHPNLCPSAALSPPHPQAHGIPCEIHRVKALQVRSRSLSTGRCCPASGLSLRQGEAGILSCSYRSPGPQLPCTKVLRIENIREFPAQLRSLPTVRWCGCSWGLGASGDSRSWPKGKEVL